MNSRIDNIQCATQESLSRICRMIEPLLPNSQEQASREDVIRTVSITEATR